MNWQLDASELKNGQKWSPIWLDHVSMRFVIIQCPLLNQFGERRQTLPIKVHEQLSVDFWLNSGNFATEKKM